MIAPDLWGDRWRIVGASGAIFIDLPRGAKAQRLRREQLMALPAGTPVVLRADGFLGGLRCRRVARRAGVRLDRWYLGIPSIASAAYVIERRPGALRTFTRTVLTVPPGASRTSLPLSAAASIARHLVPLSVLAAVIPGRIASGMRA